jgi:hypothetical protein
MARIRQFAKDMGLSYNKAKNLVNKGRKLKDGGSSVLESTMNKVKPVYAKEGKFNKADVKRKKLLTSSEKRSKRLEEIQNIINKEEQERGRLPIPKKRERAMSPRRKERAMSPRRKAMSPRRRPETAQQKYMKEVIKQKGISGQLDAEGRPNPYGGLDRKEGGGNSIYREKPHGMDEGLSEKEFNEFMKESREQMRSPVFKKKEKPSSTKKQKKQKKQSALIEVSRSRGGSFPDLSGDGKVTKKDVLIGRGVIKKSRGGGLAIQGLGFKGVR